MIRHPSNDILLPNIDNLKEQYPYAFHNFPHHSNGFDTLFI